MNLIYLLVTEYNKNNDLSNEILDFMLVEIPFTLMIIAQVVQFF